MNRLTFRSIATICLLWLCVALNIHAQGHFFPRPDPERKTARDKRRMEQRAAYQTDPWGRMPIWSFGAFISSGYDAQHALEADLMRTGSRDKGVGWGFEATKRLNKGWFVMAAIDHSTQQHVGADSLELVGWDDSWWATEYHYRADLIAVQSSINSLMLGTGVYASGFPRRHAIGFTTSFFTALSVHMVRNTYGAADDKAFTVVEEWILFGDAGDPMPPALLSQWDQIGEFEKRTSVGLSAVMGIRPELWITRRVSIPMDLQVTIPLIKPSCKEFNDPTGEVRIPAHELNLLSYNLTAGLSVHF